MRPRSPPILWKTIHVDETGRAASATPKRPRPSVYRRRQQAFRARANPRLTIVCWLGEREIRHGRLGEWLPWEAPSEPER